MTIERLHELELLGTDELIVLERQYKQTASSFTVKAADCFCVRVARDAAMILSEAAAAKRNAATNLKRKEVTTDGHKSDL